MSEWHSIANEITSARSATITLPWGHQRQLSEGNCYRAKWCNTIVQGTAAVGLKESLFEAQNRGLLKYIGAVVHDEIVASSVPDNEAQEFGQELAEAMEIGMQKIMFRGTPTPVDVDIQSKWIP